MFGANTFGGSYFGNAFCALTPFNFYKIYLDVYRIQGTSFSDKLATQNTTFSDKYVPQGTTYTDKYNT